MALLLCGGLYAFLGAHILLFTRSRHKHLHQGYDVGHTVHRRRAAGTPRGSRPAKRVEAEYPSAPAGFGAVPGTAPPQKPARSSSASLTGREMAVAALSVSASVRGP
jgi:hypothetical protein